MNSPQTVSVTCLFSMIAMTARLRVTAKTSKLLTDVQKVIVRVVNTWSITYVISSDTPPACNCK